MNSHTGKEHCSISVNCEIIEIRTRHTETRRFLQLNTSALWLYQFKTMVITT